MKSDLTPCKKILYFDKVQKKLMVLLPIGLFVSIIGLLFSNTLEYKYLLVAFLIGMILNVSWKKFFLSGKDVFLTEEEIKQAKKEIEQGNYK